MRFNFALLVFIIISPYISGCRCYQDNCPYNKEVNDMNTIDTVNKFVDAINAHDVGAIGELMGDEHTFIDSGGGVYTDVEQMIKGWPGYYEMFPDYKIEISETFISGDTVILWGKASGTYSSDGTLRPENHWEIPAAWKAVVKGDKIKLWQVIADNSIVVEIMKRAEKD